VESTEASEQVYESKIRGRHLGLLSSIFQVVDIQSGALSEANTQVESTAMSGADRAVNSEGVEGLLMNVFNIKAGFLYSFSVRAVLRRRGCPARCSRAPYLRFRRHQNALDFLPSTSCACSTQPPAARRRLPPSIFKVDRSLAPATAGRQQ
jgi:hypothetical protein